MNNKPLELQRYIEEHPHTWEADLSQEPYNLIIKREPGLVLFKYHQLMSDMSLQICREARGVILYEDDWTIARIALNKFFSSGEQYAANIDWDSARILEKVDGSICSMWFNRLTSKWQFSTNGTIDAYQAPLEFQEDGIHTFGDLIEETVCGLDVDTLNSQYTYTFEVCSKYNRIVVPYNEPQLYHLTTRDNITGEEIECDIGIPKPKSFSLQSLDEVLEAAQHLDYTQEGFVVVDKYYNRIKIKGLDYLRVHKIRGESIPTDRRILDLILHEQDDDFVGLFPEYADKVGELKRRYIQFLKLVMIDVWHYREVWASVEDRKKFATEFAKHTTYPPLMFALKDGKASPRYWQDWLVSVFKDMPTKKLLEMINAKTVY